MGRTRSIERLNLVICLGFNYHLSKAKELVILCGGQGTRLGEETKTKPKPLVEIGGMPILWHILKIYSQHGVNEGSAMASSSYTSKPLQELPVRHRSRKSNQQKKSAAQTAKNLNTICGGSNKENVHNYST